MYINSIAIENFRTFRKTEIEFVRPDADFNELGFPKPQFPNIKLLLGNNGMGKTTLLKAIALAALGPAVSDSGIYPYRLIRREPKAGLKNVELASIKATFTPHGQDRSEGIGQIESSVKVQKRGDLESLRWDRADEKRWHPIFSSESDAFFFVGFGATRRVEKKQQQVDFGSRTEKSVSRAGDGDCRFTSAIEKGHDGGSSAEAVQSRQIVDGFTASKSAHANCARSFKRLFETNPAEAQAVFDCAVEFIRSIS
jgi:predicted ATPase